MTSWLRNLFKKNKDENLEDFVLYKNQESSDTEENNDFSDTARLDLSPAVHIKSRSFCGVFRTHKKMILGIGIPVVAIVLILTLVFTILPLFHPLHGYAEATVTKGNVVSSIKTSGTLSANAHYSITALVSGTVKEAPIEVGTQVEAGTVLFRLNDTDAQLALKRAENQLEKSRSVGSYSGSLFRIYTPEAGVIQSINIRTGNTVTAGQVIGTLQRADESVVTITSAVTGTISSVNVSHGVSVSAGSLVATVTDTQSDAARRTSQYEQKNNEYDVEAARNLVDNYTILSPIKGVVTEKNAKIGDNVAMNDTKHPMMVITDTSKMRFTFQVEEKKLSEVKPGLKVSATTKSVPNKTFSGKVLSVSPEGTRNKSGKLMFDVEVLLDNPGTLKSGMNVSAKVILASANNTLHIPAKALRSPNGRTAVVLVKTTTEVLPTEATLKQAADAKIEIPKGCRLATVQYGVCDGTKVQIVSGLNADEVVVYSPDWEVEDLKPATPPKTETGSALTIPSTSTEQNDMSGDELRKEIMEKVREKQQQNAGTEIEV